MFLYNVPIQSMDFAHSPSLLEVADSIAPKTTVARSMSEID